MTQPWQRKEVVGSCVLYCGDANAILPLLPKMDACVTDPPYGINAARDRNSQKWGWTDFPESGWDKERPSKETLQILLASASNVIIWGGNYFTDSLVPSGKWLIWDKCQSEFSLADAELAWCSFDGAVRRIAYPRSRALQDGKVHPTQKPVEVMRWCLQQLPKGCETIVDPFLGSGTTGVACAFMGKRFVGIEISEHYFDIACSRIADAYARPDLFIDKPPSPVQQPLFEENAA